MAKVSSCKDLLMLLLYAKGHLGQQAEPVKGRTRLMKMVFLFEKEVRAKFNLDKVVSKEALPDFTPYDFGPFSPAVYSDLEFVEAGHAGKLSESQWKVLDEFKARCTGTSLRALLRYVYARYKDMTVKSKIREEILSAGEK